MKKLKNSDELIQGIEFILSKDRYSLTNEEVALLKDCILKLQETEKICNKEDRLNQILQIVSLLFQFFSLFKDVY